MPRGRRQLTRDKGRGALAAVFDHLEQVASLGIRQRRQEPVVDGEQIELGQAREQPSSRA
jgi:hypothetical protein